MPNFHSLRIFEWPDFRLIVTVPKNAPAPDLREPDDDPEPEIPEPPGETD